MGEDDIAEAMVLLLERAKLVVEGAGAVGVAALLTGAVDRPRSAGRRASCSAAGTPTPGCSPPSRGCTRAAPGGGSCSSRASSDRPGGLARLLGGRERARAATSSTSSTCARASRCTCARPGVQLVLETRGPEHAEAVLAADAALEGYDAGDGALVAPAGRQAAGPRPPRARRRRSAATAARRRRRARAGAATQSSSARRASRAPRGAGDRVAPVLEEHERPRARRAASAASSRTARCRGRAPGRPGRRRRRPGPRREDGLRRRCGPGGGAASGPIGPSRQRAIRSSTSRADRVADEHVQLVPGADDGRAARGDRLVAAHDDVHDRLARQPEVADAQPGDRVGLRHRVLEDLRAEPADRPRVRERSRERGRVRRQPQAPGERARPSCPAAASR